jgi:ABC-type transport system substrate-binding protein
MKLMVQRSRLFFAARLPLAAALCACALGAGVSTPRHTLAGPVRGGTIEVAFTDDMVTFDPASAVSSDWTVLNGTLYDGLYQFDRNGKPQLDLAAKPPVISPDRKTWTFTLRKGVLFSNGMEMTASDLKYSIVRVLDPHLQPAVSWGQTTDEIFQGSQAYASGKAKDVPGIQVLGPYSIRFVLTQPVAIFPYFLAESFNMVVPKAVVQQEGAVAFGNKPVGTGPYMLQSWQKGVRVVFMRNPHYFKAGTGKPYADKVIVDVNVAPATIALRVEKGEISGFGAPGQANAADLQQAASDPKLARYLASGPSTIVDRLNLNVFAPPLDNLKVRQAIAMAIDRAHLVRLLGGTGVAANQIYMPLDPQYDPSLGRTPIYPYDPAKAAALLKQSGYNGQPISLMYYNNLPDFTAMAPGLQQDLSRIGLNVTLRGVSHNGLLSMVGQKTGHQITTALWGVDFFDGYDVYAGALSCGANAIGSDEGAHYCDPAADNLANQAETLTLGPERDKLLREAQARILQGAAKIPLVYLKSVGMVSPKIGGFYYHPIFYWQFENYWVNP